MAWFDIKGRDAFSATAYGGTVVGPTWNQGEFSPNVAGSGTALQSSGSIPTWLVVVAIVGAVWVLAKRK